MSQSHLEQEFQILWEYLYPFIDLVSEYKFLSNRRYRFDFVHLESKIAIEIQGGVRMRRSAHNSGDGLIRDYTKLNLALIDGWRVFQLAPDMINHDWVHAIAGLIGESSRESLQELREV